MTQWFHAKSLNHTINLDQVSVIEWDCKDSETGKTSTRLLIIQSTIVERIIRIEENTEGGTQFDINDRISTIELKDSADRTALRELFTARSLIRDDWKSNS